MLKDLKGIRSKFPKNILFSYININSIRNKFENLGELIGGYSLYWGNED